MDEQANITAADADAFTGQGLSVQAIASIIAAGIEQAYTPTGTNNMPSVPNYGNYTLIYVYLDFGSARATGASRRRPKPRFKLVKSDDAGAIDLSVYSLFGFTAVSTDFSSNLLALRGTATTQEGLDDLIGFDEDMVPCMLPTSSSTPTARGNVNNAYWDFYSEGPIDTHWKSLAEACAEAIQAAETANPQTHNWYIGGHSLGGAMIALTMLDAQCDGTIFSGLTDKKIVVTYGSAYTGDQQFVSAFNNNKQLWFRIANLSDFVPSFNAVTPPPPAPQPYVHVGFPLTFTWQWWDDWKNHSLVNTYQVVVNQYWNVLAWIQPTYPR